MVRRPRLKLALLVGLVLVAHLVAMAWFDREVEVHSALPKMAPVMFTRLLKPAEPPPVVAPAKPAAKPRPRPHTARIVRPAASAPKPVQEAAREPEQPQQPAYEQTWPPSGAELAPAAPVQSAASDAATAASAAGAAASQAAAAASASASEAQAPAAAAPAAASAASQPAAAAASAPASATVADLDTWPNDSRLNYQLTGRWRGPIYGDARVQWQRDGEKYQVRLDVHINLLGSLVLTSQGQVGSDGLQPGAYEELVRNRRRFITLGDDTLNLNGDKTAPRPPGVQDTASQFVELSHRFATGRDKLVVGGVVTVWLARPGGVDPWVYDIVGRDRLRLPSLGEVEAYHLVPRPIAAARGNIYPEMWFAPSLQYLPVRIRMTMGDEAQVDLLVDTIQQR